MTDLYGWEAFRRLYRSGRWEPATKALLGTLLRPGDLFVDVGAWIGPVTLWAVDLGAHVIAVEPDSVAVAELRRQVDGALVEVWDCAIGAAAGYAMLAPNPKVGGFYGDSMSRLADVGLPVKVLTLPDVLNGRRPQLVKIDIEGGEMDLLPSLAPWLAAQQVPLQVSCHGAFPDQSLFAGYGRVTWPDDTWGDVVALP